MPTSPADVSTGQMEAKPSQKYWGNFGSPQGRHYQSYSLTTRHNPECECICRVTLIEVTWESSSVAL